MPDATSPMNPASWHDAFAALPAEAPPADGWQGVVTRLDARRPRARTPLWLATAAAVLLAVAVPWQLQQVADPVDTTVAGTDTASVAPADPLEALYAESAQLESLLAVARDDRMASATAAALAGELDVRLATVDAALMQPALSREERISLWRERVDSLRVITSFESNRRWLAAQGAQYQAALVSID